MERISAYLDVVPVEVLSVGTAAVLLALFSLPARRRMPLSLAVTVIWLTLGQLEGLGWVASAAKASSLVPLLVVAGTGALHPGPRRTPFRPAYAYPVVALLACAYVLNTVDVSIALVIRLQWLAATVAALMVFHTIVDPHSLLLVVRSIAHGAAVSLVLPLSALITDPAAAISGYYRFEPWGANPNAIGLLFVLAAPLCLYLSSEESERWRWPLLGASAAAVGMAVITAGHGTMLSLIVATLPAAVTRMRRRGLVATLVIATAVWLTIQVAPRAGLDRYGTLDTQRLAIAARYLDAVAERPVFGLLFSDGEWAVADDEIGALTHNAFLDWLYLGGWSLAAPMIALAGATAWSATRLWRERRRLPYPEDLIGVLIGLVAAMYLQAMLNTILYYPTYSWSLVHLLLSMWFIGTWSLTRRQLLLGGISRWGPVPSMGRISGQAAVLPVRRLTSRPVGGRR
ncbi:MAG: hypothetical protein KY434_01440 [Actinobacteria bacterium]|nr:hypothetical protein [Actinomycetota bacterium]